MKYPVCFRYPIPITNGVSFTGDAHLKGFRDNKSRRYSAGFFVVFSFYLPRWAARTALTKTAALAAIVSMLPLSISAWLRIPLLTP